MCKTMGNTLLLLTKKETISWNQELFKDPNMSNYTLILIYLEVISCMDPTTRKYFSMKCGFQLCYPNTTTVISQQRSAYIGIPKYWKTSINYPSFTVSSLHCCLETQSLDLTHLGKMLKIVADTIVRLTVRIDLSVSGMPWPLWLFTISYGQYQLGRNVQKGSEISRNVQMRLPLDSKLDFP